MRPKVKEEIPPPVTKSQIVKMRSGETKFGDTGAGLKESLFGKGAQRRKTVVINNSKPDTLPETIRNASGARKPEKVTSQMNTVAAPQNADSQRSPGGELMPDVGRAKEGWYDPVLDRARRQFDPQTELGLRANAPEGIDPNNVPNRNGPDRQPPGRRAPVNERFQYFWDGGAHSVSCDPDQWNAGTIEKVKHWGDDAPAPDDPEEFQDGCVEDDGDWEITDSDEGQDGDEGAEESGVEPDTDEDPEPEGDDPDEFMSPAFDGTLGKRFNSAIRETLGHDLALANSSGSTGPDEQISDSTEEGTGQGLRQNFGRLGPAPDPEGGGPNTLKTPTHLDAVNSAGVAGYNFQPEPDGEDPDDPRASDGRVSTTGMLRHTATPADGGQGGPPPPAPPGPEF